MWLIKSRAFSILLLCVLALSMDSVQAGSSFLSPSQRPQGKKPPRVGRRDLDGILDLFMKPPSHDEDFRHVTFNTPFEIGITMTEKQFQQYGEVLQKIMQDLLMDPPAEEKQGYLRYTISTFNNALFSKDISAKESTKMLKRCRGINIATAPQSDKTGYDQDSSKPCSPTISVRKRIACIIQHLLNIC